MAKVLPFQAYRYTGKAGRIEDLVTQPYDKISPSMRAAYLDRSPYNYVRVILGEQQPADSDTDNVYTRAAGHLRDWPNQDVFSVIADNGTDGALVIGEPFPDWHAVDLVNTPVNLVVNGETVREGSGANVLGDPMHAFVWLVNALTRDGITVKAGQVHNTGTATDIYWAKTGDRVEARYGDSGIVRLELI